MSWTVIRHELINEFGQRGLEHRLHSSGAARAQADGGVAREGLAE